MNIHDEGKSEVICHDEKEAKSESYDLMGQGIQFLREYLFGSTPWPNALVIAINKATQLELILKAILPSWSGTVLPLYNFKCNDRMLYTKDGIERSCRLAEKMLFLDSRIDLIDGFGIGSGMRHNTQSSPIMKSNHWHEWCNELNVEMRVCENPTDIIAQILSGKVIAPEEKDAWWKTIGSKTKIIFLKK